MIAVREFSSGQECIAHAQAVRAKFFKPVIRKPIVIAEVKAPAVFIPKFLHLQPQWKREALYFDAHVHEWRVELLARSSPLKAYIRRRAGELGMTYDQVMAKGRKRSRIEARHLIMWEIKRIVKPAITWQELARLFGGFDHTTALSAVRKVDRQKAAKLARKMNEGT